MQIIRVDHDKMSHPQLKQQIKYSYYKILKEITQPNPRSYSLGFGTTQHYQLLHLIKSTESSHKLLLLILPELEHKHQHHRSYGQSA